MTDLFELLFKYPLFFFERGRLTFQYWPGTWIALVLTGLLALALAYFYRVYVGRFGAFRGRLLWCLRTALLLLLALLLLGPSLVLSRLIPRESLLAVVVDDSASMSLREEGIARSERVRHLLERTSFLADLEEKFYLRLFRFEGELSRVESWDGLSWQGPQTNIAGALRGVLGETRNLPLGGIVLISDGADNGSEDFADLLAQLKTRQVPVHTVGVGAPSIQPDVEMLQVDVPRLILPESVALARVTLRQQGLGGARGRLEVREGPNLIRSQEVRFPRDSESVTVEVKLIPKSEGLKVYRFHLLPLEGERIRENNSLPTILEVRSQAPRILYVEGHPRWEYKFLRRAVSGDEHLRLESLLRTALNKFYRQGISEETTLAAGFPTQREELFQYKGLILGSVESSFFSFAQLEMIRDFVGKRGGGLMMLGGSTAYGAGKYQNTPVEEVLPVWIEVRDGREEYRRGEGTWRLSDYGQRHPALQLSLEESENEEIWSRIPPLSDWNVAGPPKPGATVLAYLQGDSPASQTPLLLFQRYGRGQTVSLLTGSTWRWQMLQKHEDLSHETFWRQALRWLVTTAKDPVTVETEREVYSRNQRVEIRAEVNDRLFNRINDARVQASVTAPDGSVVSVPLRWSVREDGVYVGEYRPQQDGLHEVELLAHPRNAGESLGRASAHFLTSTGEREFFEAAQKVDFLTRLAAETGGSYYPIQEAERLPREILYVPSQASVVQVVELWDMPALFLLLLSLLLAEWVLRRRFGRI